LAGGRVAPRCEKLPRRWGPRKQRLASKGASARGRPGPHDTPPGRERASGARPRVGGPSRLEGRGGKTTFKRTGGELPPPAKTAGLPRHPSRFPIGHGEKGRPPGLWPLTGSGRQAMENGDRCVRRRSWGQGPFGSWGTARPAPRGKGSLGKTRTRAPLCGDGGGEVFQGATGFLCRARHRTVKKTNNV